MLFTIRHHSGYSYSKPVRLGPQNLRFQPRDDGAQRVIEHRLDIGPEPHGVNEHIDLEGNRVTQVWFDDRTDHLEIALTTNGSTLAGMASKLRQAGLDRVTVSLDSLDDQTFAAMNDVDFPVDRVLEGIAAAETEGLTPIKINMVVKRGVNEDQIIPMARYFRKAGHILRFIEYMDVGKTNNWKMDEVVPAKEIVQILGKEFQLKSLEPNYPGEVARRYGYVDQPGEVGIIASVTQPFCGDCTRARLSADGHLFTCLFSAQGHDLKTMLRSGASDEQVQQRLIEIWQGRADRYSELRTSATQGGDKIEMSYIGG